MNQPELFTDFRITLLEKDNLRAIVSCKAGDAIWLTGIRVVQGARGLFICMPSRKDGRGEYQDIFFPASRQVRDDLQTKILAMYSEAVKVGGAA